MKDTNYKLVNLFNYINFDFMSTSQYYESLTCALLNSLFVYIYKNNVNMQTEAVDRIPISNAFSNFSTLCNFSRIFHISTF